jgi:hypothetical protein
MEQGPISNMTPYIESLHRKFHSLHRALDSVHKETNAVTSKKDEILRFMQCAGFDWICDVALTNGIEMVASKMTDSDDLWWRPIEVEGSGFVRLFKGSIKELYL